MIDQEDTKLDQLLGKASTFTPSSNFTQNIMSRIDQLSTEQLSVQGHTINNKRRGWKYSIYGIAASLVGILTIGGMLYNPSTDRDINSLAYEIDDAILLEEASLDLNQDDLTYAMIEIASTEGDQTLLVGSSNFMY